MIKRLTLAGSAREIGKKHGELGKEQVFQSLDLYERLFHEYQNITWQEARERALVHVKAIEKHDPSMLEEIEGIALGAGVDFEDILALNARSEIALAGSGPSFSDGCTAMSVYPPLTNDTIIAQNWDWKGEQEKSLLLLDIEAVNAPKITMVTEGGMIGKIGFNEAGVGICFNALITDKKSDQLPIHLGLRAVLNSYSMSEAIAKIKQKQIAAAASFLIGYDNGEDAGMSVNVEVSPFGMDYVSGEDGRLVHTNHVLSQKVLQDLSDMNELRFEDSMLRKKRAEQLMLGALVNNERIDEDTFKSWLGDTYNAPNAINHFKNEAAPTHRQMETVFSVVMNLSKRTMDLCVGKPSENEFVSITQEGHYGVH
ncbi:C45 family peptidase [Geomicrobium sp. JCM 19038]|uniref:C45 family autoproteolytic acyltransferase/hydolase n=1 Tax=Geomicrobium sp. JCM 19038 TaxID=1460635 RepID=UPI000694CDD8|nr:C45 family peptidase [Geomicrobium sp. JCM 19038]